MLNKPLVFSVVVTYNPNLISLESNLHMLLGQVDQIVICNNSDSELFFKELKFENIKIINFYKNIGIAAAQSVGMRWAFENGAEFVLQMDQDSKPSLNMVHELLESFYYLRSLDYPVGLIGVESVDNETNIISKGIPERKKYRINEYLYEVSHLQSSGSLVPKSTVEKIGFLENDLFIDLVDYEYCWRIIAKKLKIVKNCKAILFHSLGEGRKDIVLGITAGIPKEFRHYYAFRNTIFLFKRAYVPFTWKVVNCFKLVFKLIFYPFIMDNGYVRFKFMIKGIVAGFKGKMGMINGH